MIQSAETFGNPQNGDHCLDVLLQTVLMLGQRLAALEEKVTDIHQVILSQRVQKDWYTTARPRRLLKRPTIRFGNAGATRAGSSARKTPNRASGASPATNTGGCRVAGR